LRQYYLHDRESFQIAINAIKALWPQVRDEKLRFTVDIGTPGDPYSTAQLRKTHAWFGEIAEATGNTPDVVKDGLMLMFFPPEIVEFDGEMIEHRKSFTQLNKEQVVYLMNSIDAWAAEQGIHLE